MISFTFFFLLLISCSSFNYFGSQYKLKNNFLVSISCIFFIFLLGVRINFGTDQSQYLHMYVFQDESLTRCEPLFVIINKILKSFNAPYQILFGFIAFLQMYFLLKAFELENVNVFFGFIVFYIFYIFTYVNLLRQSIAISILFYSFGLYRRKKILKWIIFVFVAACFHKSSIIVLFVLPFITTIKLKKCNNFIYYILLLIIFVLYESMFDIILNFVFIPINLLLGSKADILKAFMSLKIPLNSGIGVRVKILAYICMLPLLLNYSNNNNLFSYYFRIFYFGLICELISSVNMNLVRMFFYFTFAQVYIIPYVIVNTKKCDFKKLDIKTLLFYFGLLMLFALFVLDITKGKNNTEIYRWNLDFDSTLKGFA